MGRAQPFPSSANAQRELRLDRIGGPVQRLERETGSKSESGKSLWFQRSPCPNGTHRRLASATPDPSIAGQCKPRLPKKSVCRRKTKLRCAGGTRSAGHPLKSSTRPPTLAGVPASGGLRAPARLRLSNGSRRKRRLPPSVDQTFWARCAGKSAVRHLEPGRAPANIPGTAPQLRLPSRTALPSFRNCFCGASCGHLLLPGKQKLKRRHDDHQQDQRHKLPRLFTHRNQAFQIFQQTSPRRHGLSHAQPEKTEIRITQDEDRNRNPKLGEDHRLQVGHYIHPKEPLPVQS